MSTRIALVARRKSGKSEVAKILARSHGFTRMALAGPLKDSAIDVLNTWLARQGETRRITRDELEANKAIFRPLLEWLGTPFGRNYLGTPTRWLDQFTQALGYMDGFRVVVDDVRQPNEATLLRELGFVIVRVIRPEHLRQGELFAAGESRAPMPSEEFIDTIEADAELTNDGTLDDLAAEVCALVQWAAEAVAA